MSWEGNNCLLSAGDDTLNVGLQHYWHPSVSGNSNDLVGNRNGTPTDMTIGVNGWDFGSSGSTVRYVTLSGPIANGTAYAISMWVWANRTAMGAHSLGGWAFSDRSATAGKDDLQIAYVKNLAKLFGDVWAINNQSYSVSATVPNQEWAHIVYAVGNGYARIFINGGFGAEIAYPDTPNDASNVPATFGNTSWGVKTVNTQWRGYIDHVRFYARLLSAADIAKLFALGR